MAKAANGETLRKPICLYRKAEMMEEIWKDVEGYEGLYQISNLGNVKSLERTIVKSYGTIQVRHERIMAKRESADGYYIAKFNVDKRSKCVAIHILVAKRKRQINPRYQRTKKQPGITSRLNVQIFVMIE